MRKAVVGVLVAALVGLAAPAYAAQAPTQDTIVDQIGDWFATIGKSGMEKDSLLAKRRMERQAERAHKALQHGANRAGRDIHQAGNNMGHALKQATQ